MKTALSLLIVWALTVSSLLGNEAEGNELQKLKEDLGKPWDKVIVGVVYVSCTSLVLAGHFTAQGDKVSVMTSQGSSDPESNPLSTSALVMTKDTVSAKTLELFQSAMASLDDGEWLRSLSDKERATEKAARIKAWEACERAASMKPEERATLEKRIQDYKASYMQSESIPNLYDGVGFPSKHTLLVCVIRGEDKVTYQNNLKSDACREILHWIISLKAN